MFVVHWYYYYKIYENVTFCSKQNFLFYCRKLFCCKMNILKVAADQSLTSAVLSNMS